MKLVKNVFFKVCTVLFCSVVSLSAAADIDIPEKEDVYTGFGDGSLVDQGLRLVGGLVGIGIGLYLVGILFTTARTAMGTLEEVRYGKAEVKDMVGPIVGGLALMAIVVLLGYFVYEMFSTS